ncbi:MAG: hypothetical protein ACOZAA_01465 [Pseudomonadota bacterium]
MADLQSACPSAPQSAAPSPPTGLAPRKWARLEAFLGALPPSAASRLFEALERGGGIDESGVPASAILATLRARLISSGETFPPRKPTAQRLFFAPFEDFFIAGRRGRKRRARIDRASLGPIWSLVLADPACAGAARAAADLDAAIARGERALLPYERALFAESGEGFARLIAHADADAAFRSDIGARLGGKNAQAGAAALHDLAEINLLLPAIAHLRAAQKAFARPLAALTEEDLFEARRIYVAAAGAPETAGYVLLAIAGRLEAPWRALPLYYHMAHAEDERLPYARADAAQIVETLFEDLEGLARLLERDADDDPDTEDAPARFAHFAEFASGVIAEAERRDDGALVSRAEACRDIAAAALSRLCEHAIAALRRVHPVRHAGGSSRLMALRPDIERPVDPIAERTARAGAGFLSKADALGLALGRPDAAGPIVADARAETRRYAGDLITEIRAAEGGERAAAKKRMEASLAAAAPLLPDGEIALLKERAAAAMVSA